MWQDPGGIGQPFAQDLAGFSGPHVSAPASFPTWLMYAVDNPAQWREATVLVQRHGYAWSFKGVLAKFAAFALITQSLLAVGHIALILSGRWTSTAWDSIGAMIAMALRSRSPAVPIDPGTGEERSETWAATVSVRSVEKETELMFAPSRAETIRLMKQ